jgi:hypothetical protein
MCGEKQIKPKYYFSNFYPPFASKKSGHPTLVPKEYDNEEPVSTKDH